MQLTKKLIGLLAIASILLLAGCATAAVQAAPAASGAEAPAVTPYNGGEEKSVERSISVQGQGTVSAKPDWSRFRSAYRPLGKRRWRPWRSTASR